MSRHLKQCTLRAGVAADNTVGCQYGSSSAQLRIGVHVSSCIDRQAHAAAAEGSLGWQHCHQGSAVYR